MGYILGGTEIASQYKAEHFISMENASTNLKRCKTHKKNSENCLQRVCQYIAD